MGLMLPVVQLQQQHLQLQLHQPADDQLSSRHSSASDVSASAVDSPTRDVVDTSPAPVWNYHHQFSSILLTACSCLFMNCKLDEICIWWNCWVAVYIYVVWYCEAAGLSGHVCLFDGNLRMQKFRIDWFQLHYICMWSPCEVSHFWLFVYFVMVGLCVDSWTHFICCV